jgi:hypothetical protein
MSVGLLLGAGFVGLAGARLARNYFVDEKDTKFTLADDRRKQGVNERLMANPILLTQYNEKYIARKLSSNSAAKHGSEKLQISRTKSLQKAAATAEEKKTYSTMLNNMTAPSAA